MAAQTPPRPALPLSLDCRRSTGFDAACLLTSPPAANLYSEPSLNMGMAAAFAAYDAGNGGTGDKQTSQLPVSKPMKQEQQANQMGGVTFEQPSTASAGAGVGASVQDASQPAVKLSLGSQPPGDTNLCADRGMLSRPPPLTIPAQQHSGAPATLGLNMAGFSPLPNLSSSPFGDATYSVPSPSSQLMAMFSQIATQKAAKVGNVGLPSLSAHAAAAAAAYGFSALPSGSNGDTHVGSIRTTMPGNLPHGGPPSAHYQGLSSMLDGLTPGALFSPNLWPDSTRSGGGGGGLPHGIAELHDTLGLLDDHGLNNASSHFPALDMFLSTGNSGHAGGLGPGRHSFDGSRHAFTGNSGVTQQQPQLADGGGSSAPLQQPPQHTNGRRFSGAEAAHGTNCISTPVPAGLQACGTLTNGAPLFKGVVLDKARNVWQVILSDGSSSDIVGEYSNELEAMVASELLSPVGQGHGNSVAMLPGGGYEPRHSGGYGSSRPPTLQEALLRISMGLAAQDVHKQGQDSSAGGAGSGGGRNAGGGGLHRQVGSGLAEVVRDGTISGGGSAGGGCGVSSGGTGGPGAGLQSLIRGEAAAGPGGSPVHYRGVRYVRERQQWQAFLLDGEEVTWLGYHGSEHDAAAAHDDEAIRRFGAANATLNFSPPEPEGVLDLGWDASSLRGGPLSDGLGHFLFQQQQQREQQAAAAVALAYLPRGGRARPPKDALTSTSHGRAAGGGGGGAPRNRQHARGRALQHASSTDDTVDHQHDYAPRPSAVLGKRGRRAAAGVAAAVAALAAVDDEDGVDEEDDDYNQEEALLAERMSPPRPLPPSRRGAAATAVGGAASKGVTWDEATCRWRAQSWDGTKLTMLGYFNSVEEAEEAYEAAQPQTVRTSRRGRQPSRRAAAAAEDDSEYELEEEAPEEMIAERRSPRFNGGGARGGGGARSAAAPPPLPPLPPAAARGAPSAAATAATSSGAAGAVAGSRGAAASRATKASRMHTPPKVTSQFKGVSWNSACSKWVAVLWDRELKRARHIGSYEGEEDAARAYDREATRMLGDAAGLNFRENAADYMSEVGLAPVPAGPDPGGLKGSSVYRGVSWHERSQRWEVRVWGGGKQHFIGSYGSEVDAARAYDKAVLRLRGQDARSRSRMNFPVGEYNLEEIANEEPLNAALEAITAAGGSIGGGPMGSAGTNSGGAGSVGGGGGGGYVSDRGGGVRGRKSVRKTKRVRLEDELEGSELDELDVAVAAAVAAKRQASSSLGPGGLQNRPNTLDLTSGQRGSFTSGSGGGSLLGGLGAGLGSSRLSGMTLNLALNLNLGQNNTLGSTLAAMVTRNNAAGKAPGGNSAGGLNLSAALSKAAANNPGLSNQMLQLALQQSNPQLALQQLQQQNAALLLQQQMIQAAKAKAAAAAGKTSSASAAAAGTSSGAAIDTPAATTGGSAGGGSMPTATGAGSTPGHTSASAGAGTSSTPPTSAPTAGPGSGWGLSMVPQVSVFFDTSQNKWTVALHSSGIATLLGRFDSEQEARVMSKQSMIAALLAASGGGASALASAAAQRQQQQVSSAAGKGAAPDAAAIVSAGTGAPPVDGSGNLGEAATSAQPLQLQLMSSTTLPALRLASSSPPHHSTPLSAATASAIAAVAAAAASASQKPPSSSSPLTFANALLRNETPPSSTAPAVAAGVPAVSSTSAPAPTSSICPAGLSLASVTIQRPCMPAPIDLSSLGGGGQATNLNTMPSTGQLSCLPLLPTTGLLQGLISPFSGPTNATQMLLPDTAPSPLLVPSLHAIPAPGSAAAQQQQPTSNAVPGLSRQQSGVHHCGISRQQSGVMHVSPSGVKGGGGLERTISLSAANAYPSEAGRLSEGGAVIGLNGLSSMQSPVGNSAAPLTHTASAAAAAVAALGEDLPVDLEDLGSELEGIGEGLDEEGDGTGLWDDGLDFGGDDDLLMGGEGMAEALALEEAAGAATCAAAGAVPSAPAPRKRRSSGTAGAAASPPNAAGGAKAAGVRRKAAGGGGTARGKSRYRGVSWCEKIGKWRSLLWDGTKQRFLGHFATDLEAAHAYDKKALELKGADAKTNFTASGAPRGSGGGAAEAGSKQAVGGSQLHAGMGSEAAGVASGGPGSSPSSPPPTTTGRSSRMRKGANAS